MRLDHSEVVLDFIGEPVRDESGPVTFRNLVILSLNNADPQENLGAEAKARCYQLSLKFFKGHKVSLTVDEASFIKERAGRILTPLVYGRLCEWLEGESPSLPSDEEDLE